MRKIKPHGGADVQTVLAALLTGIAGAVLMRYGFLITGAVTFLLGSALMLVCFIVDMRYADRWNRRARNYKRRRYM